jgi:hypothetical protein
LNWVYSQRLTYNIASVNVSIGGGSYSNQATCDAENAPTKAAIDSLRSFNIATVIASGNNSSTTFISAPGCISSAIAVGATGSPIYPDNDAADANRIANFSNQNFMVDLVAAGDGVNATDWNDGTSMAAPVVAGAWAVARSAAPAATVSDLLAVFQSTGIPIADSTRNTGGGGSGLSFRRVNLDGAVDALVAPPSIPVLNSPATNTFQNSTITLNWSRSTLTGTSLQSTRYHLQVARDIGFTQLLTGFTPLIINNTAVTPTVSQVLAAQPAGNTYYWRVQAVNQFSGTGSGYTAPFVFYTDGSPTLNFFTTSTPEISWARITWATQYEVQIATNNTFAVPVLVGGASVMRDGSTFSYTTPTLTEGTYFFRVRGLPPAGTAGAWSAIGTFVVDLP